jgi:stage V sporulation protein S
MQLLRGEGICRPGVELLTMTAMTSSSSHPASESRPETEMLKVSSKSNPNSVAGAMAGVVRESGAVEVQVVGAGALNQAVKALAIARGYVAAGGIDLVCVPNFADIEIDGERRTAIRLVIGDRYGSRPSAVSELHLAPEATEAPEAPQIDEEA